MGHIYDPAQLTHARLLEFANMATWIIDDLDVLYMASEERLLPPSLSGCWRTMANSAACFASTWPSSPVVAAQEHGIGEAERHAGLIRQVRPPSVRRCCTIGRTYDRAPVAQRNRGLRSGPPR